jgi:hypothetical protein
MNTDFKSEEIKILLELYEFRKDDPEQYEDFLQGVKAIIKDFARVSKELSEELE